jgi:hypothetical protein
VPLAKGVPFKNPPEAKDLLDAQAKNLTYQETNGQWELGQVTVTPMFRLNVPSEAKILEDMPELGKGGIGGVTALQTLLMVLKSGFAIEQTYTSSETADNPNGTAHLVMRSLVGVMAAAAQEQAGFDDLMKSNPFVDQVHFKDLVPPLEQRPIMRLTWKPDDEVIPPLVQLTYENQTFMVTDKSNPTTPEELSWNRDLFRLISQLTAQVTVDISKFPLPTLLQLHTD